MGITLIGGPPATGGGTVLPVASASGVVAAGDAASLVIVSLADGETLEVSEASLVLSDGQPPPTGLDLLLVTYDGSGNVTLQSTIISGDGATQFVDESGEPLASYENTTGGSQLAGFLADNGQVGGGTGSNQDVLSEVSYEKVS